MADRGALGLRVTPGGRATSGPARSSRPPRSRFLRSWPVAESPGAPGGSAGLGLTQALGYKPVDLAGRLRVLSLFTDDLGPPGSVSR